MMRGFPFLATLALTAVCATVLHAQSPRVTLVEEATNASCAPCAAQNPTFKAYLSKEYNSSRLIPIIYHANWPGRDIMNQANPTVHNGRVSYYGINSVPTAIVNGRIPTRVAYSYDGAPADTAAVSRAVAAAAGMSPITLTVRQEVSGDQVTVTTTVSSTGAVSNKKLRIAVVEGYRYYPSAGTNGEKEFMHVVRDMLPNNAGESLTLTANETKTFTHQFTYSADWLRNEIYMVAFVQDDNSREVLQAATDMGTLDMQTTGATTLVNASANEPVEFQATVTPSVSGAYTLTATPAAPTGWTTEVLFNGSTLQSGASVELQAQVPAALTVRLIPVASKDRRGEVLFSVRGPRGSGATAAFRLYSRDLDVIVLNRNEGNDQIVSYYQRAIERGASTYAFVAPGDEPLLGFDVFKVMVCEVGKSILTGEDVAYLRSYIDRGGRLFLIGAEIAWGLADPGAGTGVYQDIPFLQNYLHADYVADDFNDAVVRGVAGDPFSDGLSFNFTTGVQNQDTPDRIAPRSGAVATMTYQSDASAVAGIRYADAKNRLIYLGFGLEGILSHATRGTVLDKGIQWLLGSDVTPVDAVSAPLPLSQELYPNPARGSVAVRATLDRPGALRIAVYDLIGRLRMSDATTAAAGETVRSLDVSSLPAGSYLVHVTAAGRSTSTVLRIAR